MTKNILLAALVLVASSKYAPAANPDTAMITIIVSGETHAMLGPCDCPVDPGGGLAERATILNTLGRPANRLLLDAGGFGGGGIYDNYTGGRSIDSLRTLSTIRAMGAMNYDAVAIGDDDLIYGGSWLWENSEKAGLPLVSSNCFLPVKRPLTPLFHIVDKNGIRFGIVSLAPSERLFKRDDSVSIAPPFGALRSIWQEVVQRTDFQIVLSHLGEGEAHRLADSFPGCAIIVNGHRKTSAAPVALIGKTLIMQFGFEGKKLAVTNLVFNKATKSFREEKSGWVEVARGTSPDSAVAALCALPAKQDVRPVYDLYVMSNCPYGCAALGEFMDFIKLSPAVEWNLWFIGTVDHDSLLSLHGRPEVDDEMVWLAVKALYPDKWTTFLDRRSRENAATAAVLADLSLDTLRIKKWAKENGKQSLAEHYERSMRLAISASPTLLINNSPFEKNIESRRLAKGLCLTYDKKPGFCTTLPECFDDGDCRKKGFTGTCNEKGKCSFAKDAPFTFTALVADSTRQHPEKAVLTTTEELFPAVSIDVVMLGSKKGRELDGKYAPLSLPLYLFGTGVEQARNFSQIKSGIVRIKDALTFKEGITPANYFPSRARKPGSILFLIDPFFPDAVKVLRAITERTEKPSAIRVLPVIYADPSQNVPVLAVDEKLRQEETLRWLVIDSLYRDKYFTYLSGYAKTGASSYWFLNLGKTGITQEPFIKEVEVHSPFLTAHWKLLQKLGIKDPITVMLDNQEIVPLRSEKDLTMILGNLPTGKQAGH